MVGLGLALSAFFWLPAFFEQVWTRYSPGLFDYTIAFLPLKEMLAWPPQLDLDLFNPYPPRSQSWGMLFLAACGIGIAGWRAVAALRGGSRGPGCPYRVLRNQPALRAQEGRENRATTAEWLLFALVFVAASFLPLDASAWLWRTVTSLQVVQMPWRFLGIAALGGSMCTGYAIACLPKRMALWGTGGAMALLVAASIPWTYAAPFAQPENAGVADILAWELGTGLIGGTSAGEFMPAWSSRLPTEPADPALLTRDDAIAARFDETSLPEGARLISADYELMRAELVIDSPTPFSARYKQLYFPGWQVRIDGKAVPLVATAPYGLLGFEVPAGKHRILVRPATTPLRTAGTVVSILGVVVCIVLVVPAARGYAQSMLASPPPPIPPLQGGKKKPGWPLQHATRHSDLQGKPLPPPCARVADPRKREGLRGGMVWLALLALVILGVKEGIIDRTDNLFRAHRFDGERVPGAQTEAHVNFGNVLVLHGYDLPQRPVASGQAVRVDLYLSARPPVDGDYMAYARLVDEEGRLWSLRDNGTPQEFRPPPSTTIWPSGAYGHWSYLAYTLPGTPPGTYWVEVGLFERGTWRGLNVLDAAGRIAGLSTRIGPVQIARPVRTGRAPPEADALGIARRLDRDVVPSLRCLGSTVPTRAIQAGEHLDVTLFWQAVADPGVNYTVELALAGTGDKVLLASGLPLGRHEHPPTAWKRGEVVRSPHRVRVPATTVSGRYAIEATLVDPGGEPAAQAVRLDDVEVQPTNRSFAVPEGIQHRLDANLARRAMLLGYSLEPEQARTGDSLAVTLYWQALDEMDTSYKVSVQLVGAGGVLVQVDAVPLAWTRPTTGWIAGEVLVDTYSLSIPADAQPGSYRLIAGMYDEGSLQRLAVVDASGVVTGDHVTLHEIAVR
jgi:hypothetical protein